MKIDTRHLVGNADIAERLGVQRSAVSNWRLRDPSFPAPVVEPGGTPIWDWRKIEAWAIKSGRARLLPIKEPHTIP